MQTTDIYKRNPNLPKAGVKKDYTPEQIQEMLKCIADPIYFAKTHFRIVSLDEGIIPFTLYEYQEEAIDKFMNNKNMIINASRQSGKTSVATVILLHYAMYNPDKTVVILANKASTANEVLGRVKKAYELLPSYLKVGVKEWNKGRIELENGSRIIAEASSAESIRGMSVNLLYIDELAFVENWDEFSASVLPTLSSGKTTKMIFTSTPKGLNHFYYYVKNARDKKNDFSIVEVPWTRVPGRDKEWKEKKIAELNFDELRFEQEYNLEFIGSSGTLISGNALKAIDLLTPVIQDENNRQYEKPIKGHIYAIICDVSRGKGLDYSAFSVIDITTLPHKQVYVYRSNLVTPTDYADIIFRVGMLYNEAHCLVEINDLGGQVVDIVYNAEYENIIYTENKGRKGKQWTSSAGSTVDRGIRTTTTVKGLGCATLKLLIEQNQLIVNDSWTVDELNTFSKKGKSWEAEKGKHDDLVMGLVLFAWLTTQPSFKDLTDQDLMQALKEKSIEQLEEELVPFGFLHDGITSLEEDEEGWEIVETYEFIDQI